MSIERDRFLYVCRVMVLWLGAFLAWVLAVAAGLFEPALIGGLLLALGVDRLVRRTHHARLRAGRPVAWAGPGRSPEEEGFARFGAWTGISVAWLMLGSAIGGPLGAPEEMLGAGWLVLTLACYAEAVRWMVAPGRPDAHEDELLHFALGLLAPVAYPLFTVALTTEAGRAWGLVGVGLAGAPLAIAWELRRARRLAPADRSEGLPAPNPALPARSIGQPALTPALPD